MNHRAQACCNLSSLQHIALTSWFSLDQLLNGIEPWQLSPDPHIAPEMKHMQIPRHMLVWDGLRFGCAKKTAQNSRSKQSTQRSAILTPPRKSIKARSMLRHGKLCRFASTHRVTCCAGSSQPGQHPALPEVQPLVDPVQQHCAEILELNQRPGFGACLLMAMGLIHRLVEERLLPGPPVVPSMTSLSAISRLR